jgi:hypothetical protein
MSIRLSERLRPGEICASLLIMFCVPNLYSQVTSDAQIESVEPTFSDAAVFHAGDTEGAAISAQDPQSDSQGSAAAGTPPPNQQDSITNGPDDWVHHWLRNVDKARSEQPHYVAPLITTHVLLVEQFRLDTQYQTSSTGVETSNYGAMHGLEIIPNTRMEVQVGIPPYLFHDSPKPPDGFGDASIFLKFRIASATEGQGGYFVGAFLGASFPTGSPGNSMGHTIWTPMFAAAKRWRFFDWQTNFAGNLPQSGTAILGRQILFNNTFQFDAYKSHLWPEVEDNVTYFAQGPNSGKTQNFLTPGLLIGPFHIAERLHFEPGGGIQIATGHFYTYNHRWIWTVRFPF